MSDGMGNGNSGQEKIANSVTLILISRVAMILAVAALPVAGWMIQRGISSIDDISRKIDTLKDQAFETSASVKLIQLTLTNQTQMIADHEARVRILENRVPRQP